MTVWNLGSINADHVYRVPHLPGPGETLAATGYDRGLGGKGANMSVALARAGARVEHIGAIGPDGAWARALLENAGVRVHHIAYAEAPTGHANICVDASGENVIVLLPGANRALELSDLEAALANAAPGDWLLMQNETNLQAEALHRARAAGLRCAYAAAPFEAAQVTALLEGLDLLLLNEVEAEQLRAATGRAPQALGVADVVVTLGARGCRWHGAEGAVEVPAPRVQAVDTTGAGDCFTGYLLAGLDAGLPMREALSRAVRAAALAVTRPGAAAAVPTAEELDAWTPGTDAGDATGEARQ